MGGRMTDHQIGDIWRLETGEFMVVWVLNSFYGVYLDTGNTYWFGEIAFKNYLVDTGATFVHHLPGMVRREDFLSYVLNFYKSELAKCENND
jgi:hypothetical protein